LSEAVSTAIVSLGAYSPNDLAGLIALVPGATHDGIAEHLDYPGYDSRRDLRVARAGGDLIAARDLRIMARGDEDPLILESWGPTAASAWDTSAPRDLFAWMLGRAIDMLGEHGRRRAVLQVRAGIHDETTQALFTSFGLSRARTLWSMEHSAPGSVEEPSLPPDIAVRAYAPGRHDEQWRMAFNDAFADHWGGWMQMSAPFWERYVNRPGFHPDLSLVAWDGDEIAGFCHCRLEDSGEIGMIRYVGVRPGWRRRGLGEALTRLGLVTLHRAGATRVTLGVDATNTTGAQVLYQRLGFAMTRESAMFRKELTR
jgi:mycothiol synthase